MRRYRLVLVFLGLAAGLLCLALAAQTFAWQNSGVAPLPLDRGAVGLRQELRRLATTASALQITAHPDDEDGGMLTYEARGQGARMGLLTLTRGEGGQNIISDDYFDAAGILRTREVLDADRFYGVTTQMFTRAVDFGYSRSVAETRDKWGEQRVLADMVLAIRRFRPLVILSRFQGAPRDGHAHHQFAGLMSRVAFREAGDPKAFPEQLTGGLRPWRARKLYMDNVRENEVWNVAIPSGDYDPVLGDTYLDISRHGWWQHVSQYGGGAIAHPGAFFSYYKRLSPDPAGADHEASFFAGLDTSLPGLAAYAGANPPAWLTDGLRAIAAEVAAATAAFRLDAPQDCAPALARGLADTRRLAGRLRGAEGGGADGAIAGVSSKAAIAPEARAAIEFELNLKEGEFTDAIADALGAQIWPVVSPAHRATGFFARFSWPDTLRVATPGASFGVDLTVASRSPLAVAVTGARLEALWRPAGEPGGGWRAIRPVASMAGAAASGGAGAVHAPPASEKLSGTAVASWRFQVTVPADAAYTRPYWKPRASVEESWYQLGEPQYILRPFAPYPLRAEVTLLVAGVPVTLRRLVLTTRHETGPGQVLLPLIVGPPISVALAPRVGVIPLAPGRAPAAFTLTAQVTSQIASVSATADGISAGASARAKATGESAAAREPSGSLHLNLPPGWRSSPASAAFTLPRDGAAATVAFRVQPAGAAAGARVRVRAVADFGGRAYDSGFRMVGYPGLRPYPFYEDATYAATVVPVRVAPGLRLGYVMGTGDSVPRALATLGAAPRLLTAEDLATGDLSQYDEIILGVRAYAARADLVRFNQRLLRYVRAGGVLVVQYNTAEMNHDFGPYPYDMSRATRVTQEERPVRILRPDSPLFTFPNRITAADFGGWVEERGHGFWDQWAPQYTPLLETHDAGQPPQEGGLLVAHYGKGLYVYDAYALYRQLEEGVPGAFRLLANLISLPKAPGR